MNEYRIQANIFVVAESKKKAEERLKRDVDVIGIIRTENFWD